MMGTHIQVAQLITTIIGIIIAFIALIYTAHQVKKNTLSNRG